MSKIPMKTRKRHKGCESCRCFCLHCGTRYVRYGKQNNLICPVCHGARKKAWDDQNRSEISRYNREYYLKVTKPKRQEKRDGKIRKRA